MHCCKRGASILGRTDHVKFAVVVVAALLCVAGAAEAQKIELSKLKCREFIDLPKDTVASITLWLDGYYTDQEDPAVLDLEKMKLKAEKLVAYCAQNPKLRVMSAAEDVVVK
jgi:hypothetical protein